MIRPFLLLRKSVVFKITLVILLMAISFTIINAYLINRQFREVSLSKRNDQISLTKITATILAEMAYDHDYSRMMDVLNNLKEEGREHKLYYGVVMDNRGYAYVHTDDQYLGTNLKDPRTEKILGNLASFEKEKIFIQEFKDDATAFDATKRGTILNKGIINNKLSAHIFTLLSKKGIPTHFTKRLNDRDMLVKRVEIVPVGISRSPPN
jgi:hypothetical protein